MINNITSQKLNYFCILKRCCSSKYIIFTHRYKISYLNVNVVERAYVFCYSISFIPFWSMDIIVIDMSVIFLNEKYISKNWN